MKYPGAFILNEYGTNKELAKIYGVSERTIYRWKNKAKKETGARVRKPTRPRVSTLQKFKGTRKELAKRYGVSERTAYRWIAEAKAKGAEIAPRQKKATYPGAEILLDKRTNKNIAKNYNVSERTVQRWKRRARTETEEPFEVLSPEPETVGEPYEVLPPDDLEDIFEEPFETVDQADWTDEHTLYNLSEISDLLTMGDDPLIDDNSLYFNLSPDEQLQYLDAYLRYQYGQDEHQFYDEATHSMMFDPDDPNSTSPGFIANLPDIWGDPFEEWLSWQDSVRDIRV